MNTPDSARSLDEAELARLDDLLALAHPEQSMMLEEYDGFCAALACSPTPISPDDSLPVVLGAEPGVALAALPEADRGELLSLLGRHRRAVARRLYEGEAWNAVIGTNLTSAFLLCRAFVPPMKGKGYGRILNMTSIMTLH
jgi:yecA family protein